MEFTCSRCDKIFKYLKDRYRHMKIVHLGLCQRECPSCGKKVNRKNNFERHIRTCKSSTKCPHCEKEFKLFSQCRFHIQRDHKDKLFKCEKWRREYVTLRTFKQHSGRCKEQVSILNKTYIIVSGSRRIQNNDFANRALRSLQNNWIK